MSLSCQGIISRLQKCNSVRYSLGRIGYKNNPIPQAIVLHPIRNISLDSYESIMLSPLTSFDQSGSNPKSVHFIVSSSVMIQYVDISNTTFGIDYLLNPSWTGLSELLPITDINGPFIHIGYFDDILSSNMIDLLCCITLCLNKALPIISGYDLQDDREEVIIPSSLSEQVLCCFKSGGLPEPVNIYDLEKRIKDLEECCIINTAEISKLKNRVSDLTARMNNIELRVNNLELSIQSILNQIAIIPLLQQQIEILVNQVQNIINTCCPVTPNQSCFEYQLITGQEMVITPNQPVWINLPTKISDQIPALVTPGPLWRASLLGSCNWSLNGLVRFRLSEWCKGKSAKLFLVACGQNYLLDSITIQSSGLQVVTLSGGFILPPGCTDVHLLVSINDDIPKIVEFGDFKGCSVC